MTGHEKDEALRKWRAGALGSFLTASICFAVTALLSLAMNMKSGTRPGAFAAICTVVSVLFFIAANVFTIRGFSAADKAYTLSDENGCYLLGRRMKRFAIICFIIDIVCELIVIPSFLIVEHYGAIGSLTEVENAARNNLYVIMSLAIILMQIFSGATVYMRYLLRLSRVSKKGDRLGTFALAVSMILLVQLVLAVIAQILPVIGHPSEFLMRFSYILLVVKYLLLIAYFAVKRRTLETSPAPAEAPAGED